MDIEEIRDRLEAMSGNNLEVYQKLTPGIKPVLGVRIPELRKLAKEIAKEDYKGFLVANPMDTFELETLQAFVIGYAKDDIQQILHFFRAFVPLVHDWSVNDSLCQTFRIARKYPQEVYDVLMEYVDSKDEFEVRIVAVTLMSHFLNDTYIDQVIEVLDRLYAKDYYAKMGIAWAVATVMAKYPDKCMAYLKNNHLDDWTYNKSIQKMIESYRVSDADKEMLRAMKRK